MGLDNPIHIAFLVVILLLVFGAKRLPEMGRSLGSGMRGFKDSLEGGTTSTTTPVAVVAQATREPVAAAPEAHVAATPAQ
jgi:sec-independent protein translocase protein TatA